MSREIKLRAWDKVENEMIHVSALYLEKGVSTFGVGVLDEHNDFHRIDDIILEQFTGLHDKTGREIYEGDIIVTAKWDKPMLNCECTGVVEFLDGYFHMRPFLVKHFHPERSPQVCRVSGEIFVAPYFVHSTCNVIGDIHENPDLLGDQTAGKDG